MNKHSGKPRGARAKKRLKDKMCRSKFNSFKYLNTLKASDDKLKLYSQHISLISKYWGLRKRLLLNQYGPFHRELKRVGFKCPSGSLYIAYYNAQKHHSESVKRLQSFKFF